MPACLGVSLCTAELRLRAGVNRRVRTRRAASADGSLTMITRGRGLKRAEGLRLTGAAAPSSDHATWACGVQWGGVCGSLVLLVAVRTALGLAGRFLRRITVGRCTDTSGQPERLTISPCRTARGIRRNGHAPCSSPVLSGFLVLPPCSSQRRCQRVALAPSRSDAVSMFLRDPVVILVAFRSKLSRTEQGN